MKANKKRFATLSVSVAIVLVCAGFLYAGIHGSNSIQRATQSTQEFNNKDFHARLRRGVGSEVHQAVGGNSPAQVEASIASMAGFIYGRSNMNMSDETKKKLAKAEQSVLEGKTTRLSVAELSDIVTGVITDRLAALRDDEIEQAADTFRATPEGIVSPRYTGKWGFLHRDELVAQLKAGREQSKRKRTEMRKQFRPVVVDEINERISYLSEAMPEQFGRMNTDGVTPLQSILIFYSIAADDPLSDSQAEIASQVTLYKQHRTYIKGERVKRPHDYDKAFGVNGVMYASPIHLLFNHDATDTLVNRFEKGGEQR